MFAADVKRTLARMSDAAHAGNDGLITTTARSLSLGAYLAASWTWCIGMFLPTMLMRDFGGWAFWAFAVPNILGAAVMGLVLSRPGDSERMVAKHWRALSLFSLVTVSFQVFFMLWLARSVPFHEAALRDPVVLASLGAGLIACAVAMSRESLAPLAGVVVLLVSIAAGVMMWRSGTLDAPDMAAPVGEHATRLASLAPVCLFGFALCPYADLTFHHARQRASGGVGSAAFVIGFGLMFAAMITMTAGYAHLFNGSTLAVGLARAGTGGAWLVVHLFVQLLFTCGVHARAWMDFRGQTPEGLRVGWGLMALAFVMVGLVPAAGAMADRWLHGTRGWEPHELVYRVYMSAYGLLFPAYVWLCVAPTRHGATRVTKWHVGAWALSCLIAAPAFWMGFIERREIWLLPGLGVVLLAGAIVPWGRRD